MDAATGSSNRLTARAIAVPAARGLCSTSVGLGLRSGLARCQWARRLCWETDVGQAAEHGRPVRTSPDGWIRPPVRNGPKGSRGRRRKNAQRGTVSRISASAGWQLPIPSPAPLPLCSPPGPPSSRGPGPILSLSLALSIFLSFSLLLRFPPPLSLFLSLSLCPLPTQSLSSVPTCLLHSSAGAARGRRRRHGSCQRRPT
jgi:hypothetical protein